MDNESRKSKEAEGNTNMDLLKVDDSHSRDDEEKANYRYLKWKKILY